MLYIQNLFYNELFFMMFLVKLFHNNFGAYIKKRSFGEDLSASEYLEMIF